MFLDVSVPFEFVVEFGNGEFRDIFGPCYMFSSSLGLLALVGCFHVLLPRGCSCFRRLVRFGLTCLARLAGLSAALWSLVLVVSGTWFWMTLLFPSLCPFLGFGVVPVHVFCLYVIPFSLCPSEFPFPCPVLPAYFLFLFACLPAGCSPVAFLDVSFVSLNLRLGGVCLVASFLFFFLCVLLLISCLFFRPFHVEAVVSLLGFSFSFPVSLFGLVPVPSSSSLAAGVALYPMYPWFRVACPALLALLSLILFL